MFWGHWDFIIDCAIGAGAYYVGKENGKKAAERELEDKRRDAEINELRRQLNELKNKKS
jgi:hypothetical protein